MLKSPVIITSELKELKYPSDAKRLKLKSAKFKLPIDSLTKIYFEGIVKHSLTEEQIVQGNVPSKIKREFVCQLSTKQVGKESCVFDDVTIYVRDLSSVSFKLETSTINQEAKVKFIVT